MAHLFSKTKKGNPYLHTRSHSINEQNKALADQGKSIFEQYVEPLSGKQGFASMNNKKQKEIAKLGGLASGRARKKKRIEAFHRGDYE